MYEQWDTGTESDNTKRETTSIMMDLICPFLEIESSCKYDSSILLKSGEANEASGPIPHTIMPVS